MEQDLVFSPKLLNPKTEVVKYHGKYLLITEEQIDNTLWERCYMHDGVIIFPQDENGKFYLIQEHRPHERPQVRWKMVTGIIESDQSPLENAQRELQEEIGLKADSWELFHELKYSGSVNNTAYFFLAKNLSPCKIPNPDGDVILKVDTFTLEEIHEKLMNGTIPWSISTLGVFKLIDFKKSNK